MRRPLVLSTSPFAHPTHWGQTLLYLREEHVVSPGQLIRGRIRFSRCEGNARDIRISLRHSLWLGGPGPEAPPQEEYTLRTELRY